ncbi:amidohydrolase [Pochonia chlamydosporia 170]|uniref:6-methylsalicylate decarboxylase n=1 Tax=Pochonia chlamydosporia 170 TaxID=1380566 RepID=A0A219ANE7_METCM|nr:amidohydrolase [Pochonia chlamydosporia 170]OWT42368.1 amidohydrolase [Pochonia chlamydosporia 170]
MSNFYGMYFGDPDLFPIYEALNKLNVTIFEHPTTPCTEYNHLKYDITAEAPTITQKEWQSLNRPVATRQFAAPTLDFPFDTARTFADLFYSEIPTRFSRLKWIIPHAGGGLIPTLDRIVGYSTLYPHLNLTRSSMIATLAKSFYFDLAGPWPVDSAIPSLLRWVDYTHIMWGSDIPFTPLVAAAAGISHLTWMFRRSDVAMRGGYSGKGIRELFRRGGLVKTSLRKSRLTSEPKHVLTSQYSGLAVLGQARFWCLVGPRAVRVP